MSRVYGDYPTPIHGVSTLAPRNRLEGHAGVQENFRSDPVKKLTRRPSTKWISAVTIDNDEVLNTTDINDIHIHTFLRNGSTYKLITVLSTGKVYAYKDNVFLSTVGDLGGYQTTKDNLVVKTIGVNTYFVNKSVKVLMKDYTKPADTKYLSYINITKALNYSETVTVTVKPEGGSELTAEIKIPDVGDDGKTTAADKARATNQAAINLGGQIDDLAGISANVKGSNISIYADSAESVQVDISSGQSDSDIAVTNNVTDKITGLPKYAKPYSFLEVRSNPDSEKGRYYLEAVPTKTQDSYDNDTMVEVIWTQTKADDEPFEYNQDTMPKVITFDEEANTFAFSTDEWEERKAGDNNSVKIPEFVNNNIVSVGSIQNRLVFLSNDSIVMSETDEPLNFWRKSATSLVASDSISVKSNATGIDTLEHIIPHNRDLLIIASNGQFKISGAEPLVPRSVSMTLTTKYDVQTKTAPVGLGGSVLLPIDYGDSSGLQAYTSEKNTEQDIASQLTQHVVGYMSGKITQLTASANLEMVAIRTENCEDNEVFIYEQFTTGKGIAQKSWSSWKICGNIVIMDIEFNGSKLVIHALENDRIIIEEVDMYARVSSKTDEVYLDELLILDTDGTTVTLPANYIMKDETIVVRGKGTNYELFRVKFTENNGVLTLSEDIGAGEVYIGKPFKSIYRPTRPFKYDEDGRANTTDAIRIKKFVLNIVESYSVSMKIISPYYQYDDQVFRARSVGGFLNSVGEINLVTEDVSFSCSHQAADALVEFYTDSYLGLSITGITWNGQYYTRKRRLR